MPQPQSYKIDQARTFERVRYLDCEPKRAFGDPDRQEMTKDGQGKYVAQLAAQFRQFGRSVGEMLSVGLVGETNPCEGIAPGTPVELIDFEIGVGEKTKRDPDTGERRVVGVQVWYRCSEIRPISETPADRKQRTATTNSAATAEATS